MKSTFKLEIAIAGLKLRKSINGTIVNGGKESDKFITVREACINENKFIDSILKHLEAFLNIENE